MKLIKKMELRPRYKKIAQIGGSLAVILPKQWLNELGWGFETPVRLECRMDADGEDIIVVKKT